MKQDVADSPAPSWSEADDDAILDSIDDVMWDELRGLSTPQTPRGMSDYMYSPSSPVDVIRGASPVHSPALQVQTLQSEYSLIRGEDQDPVHQLSTTLQFGLNPAQYNAIWASQAAAASASAMAMPMMDTPMSPALTWTSVKAEQMQCDPPNPSAMERRRQKNRDCMRRARQRQRDELNEMKSTVARLEKQYAELSLQSTQKTSMQTEGALATRMASDCAEAAELSRRLGAENLYLKAEIQQKAEWKINLSRILQSTMEVDGPRWAQQFQQPSLGGEAVLRMRLDERDRFEAREEFGFHPLTDLGLTQVILDNRRTISRVQSRLLVPSSFDTDDGARTRRVQIFGWDMAQRVHGNIMDCVFTKKFRGLNVS
ncbi:hypothetical protein PI124_g8009 [Phytophthora idaei]|nr:hypothetical protein PI124_g8009 [Phytophthora idaei]